MIGCFLEASRFATIFSVTLSSVSVARVVAAVCTPDACSLPVLACGVTSTHGAGVVGSREATDTWLLIGIKRDPYTVGSLHVRTLANSLETDCCS